MLIIHRNITAEASQTYFIFIVAYLYLLNFYCSSPGGFIK